ncbi:MAG: hypothetical protein L3J37_09025 [Rhodobacteraceae bacterium]|nr:hypothetical protein [Paracoccaceae bacterium]
MLKNDRMMTLFTGLILAIFAGSMVKYGDRIISFMTGETEIASQDDSYSVLAGASQILDVLSNDSVKGPIVVLSRPACGAVELTGNNRLAFISGEDCSGEVEFAYCVDSEGACAPNAVRINVISVTVDRSRSTQPDPAVAMAGNTQQESTPEPAPREEETVAQIEDGESAGEDGEPLGIAQDIEALSTVMAPPSLAAPSIPELVSPDIAVASIRQSAGGLITASETDRNIEAQNSAGMAQTTSVQTPAFQAPALGESSNVSLGSGETRTASAPAAQPSGLQPTLPEDRNITQLERGPEALAALKNNPALPFQEAAPLSTNPERTRFAPVEVAAAPAASPSLDESFSARARDGGPIALIALQTTRPDGNAAGESLNVFLSEPGEQIFAKAQVPPPALAPASPEFSQITVLERAPSVADSLSPLGQTTPGTLARIAISQTGDRTPVSASTLPLTSAAPELAFAAPPSYLRPVEPPADTTEDIQQASLPTVTEAPVSTAPAQNSSCTISLSARALRGAMVELDIDAGCKPNQIATITHAGLAFSVLTDENGQISQSFPAMEENAGITVTFADESSASTEVMIADIADVERAGVSWKSGLNLDLNAFEYGAAVGSEGHVSPQSPRDPRTSRLKGGGYLLQLGDPSLDGGALTEIYTMPISRNQQRGTVTISILIEDSSQVCGEKITAKTSRTREGRRAGIRNVRYTAPACGEASANISLPGAIDDIRLAGR